LQVLGARGSELERSFSWAPTAQKNRVRVRDLCAGIGALEEPASGTTSAALALYLARHGLLAGSELVVEQGIEMGRSSRIDVDLEAPDIATVRGAARKRLSGTLEPWSDDGKRLSR
jgi:predicted PhzF superfamily epimerase YddE/YHI9